VRRRAVEDMDRGRYQEAARNLQDHLNWLGTMPAAADDPSLHAEVQQLSLLSRDIEKQRDLARARKSMVYQSANVQRGRREKDRSPSGGSDREEK
jgi:hypothetical protein